MTTIDTINAGYRIDTSTLMRVREMVLSEVIGRHVRLTRRGREFVGLCPFHRERTPSFTVNDDKGFYHCFGCGAHGDSIDFVMNIGNVRFIDAIEMLLN